jgi:peptidyl-tRNA hydrolase, PTH2 family
MKQVLIMRADLGMSPGKLASQAAHAAVLAYKIAPTDDIDEWERSGITKIVLQVWDEETLIKLYKLAIAAYLPCALVADEGVTEVKPGSITGLGIGPADNYELDAITGTLELYGKESTSKTTEEARTGEAVI